MEYVTGIRPPMAGYVGGKCRMARQLVGMIPPHRKYVEPFFGAGWVFFKKPRAKVEIINDNNGELINFYRVMRERPGDLEYLFKWSLLSREEFNRQRALDPKQLDELQRAYRFYYLFCCCFGGKFSEENEPTFTMRTDGAIGRNDFRRIPGDFEAARRRLEGVQIECRDFGDLILRNNDADAVFFLDPPYEATEQYYGKGEFANSGLNRLQAILCKLRAKFILTINDSEYTRYLFGQWHITERRNVWTVSREKRRQVTELIVTNFETQALMREAS